jgi:hypothetical protein
MDEKTIYLGSGKTINETFRTITVNITDAEEQGLITEFKGKKYLRLKINNRKTPDNYGKDLSVAYDRYEPPKKN